MLRSLNPWIAGLLKLLLWGLAAYAGLCLAAFLGQRRLMYFPERTSEREALQRAARLGLGPWRDGEGRIIGWRRPLVAPAHRPRVLLMHGNAGDAQGRVAYLPLLEAAGFEAVLLEYPGYGCRPGAPSEAAFVADARAALARLRTEGAPIFLLGESLGSGVAAQVAAADPAAVAGLLLVTPFARMTEVAAWHYPIFPMGLLLRDRWNSLDAIRNYPGPVSLLIAGRDEVVGAPQGHRLAEACPGPNKAWEVPLAGHNELPLHPGPPWSEALAFLRARSGMGQ
ncbi:MAG: alpha/beta hydrolase [Holophagaceae bacterium]|uniref:Alpha/beta hydrolase n=1 Tax=Candidatus Geothrix skivensis TaxID=2954439 RepID=A0A9D7SGY1_9BACT|nr:alpha/beta hydrolase [Candidatus Geothrix skivensis]